MYMRHVSLGYMYLEHVRTNVVPAEVCMLLMLLYFQVKDTWRHVKIPGRCAIP